MRAAQYKAIKKLERSALDWGRANGLIDFDKGTWWSLNMSGGLAQRIPRQEAIRIAKEFRGDGSKQDLPDNG